MTLLDMIIIAIMVFLIIRGILRGFFREIGSLAGVILGVWLAIRFHPQMTAYLKPYLPAVSFLHLVSFAVIFTIILLACHLAGWSLKMLLKKSLLGWMDRGLGAALAILKGIIVIYLAIVLLTFLVPSKTPLIAESRLAPLIIQSYQSIVAVVSPATYQEWKQKIFHLAS